VVAVGVFGLWSLGRLPVERVWREITDTRDRLASLAEVPDLSRTTPLVVDVQATATALANAPRLLATTAATSGPKAALIGTATVAPPATVTSAAQPSATVPVAPTAAATALPPTPTFTPVPSATPAATETATATATVTATPSPTDTATPEPSPTAAVPGGGTRYKVRAGDTLANIGDRFGVSWQSIAAANGLGPSSILSIGQELIIPGVNPPAATPTTPPAATKASAMVQPASPAPGLPAPVLTMPGDDASYSGTRAQIALRWQPVPGIPADAAYQIEFRWLNNGVTDGTHARVPSTSTDASAPTWIYLRADQPGRRYTWWVRAVQVATDGQGGERVVDLSLPSETRAFYWN
jgi:LysM repeat protein